MALVPQDCGFGIVEAPTDTVLASSLESTLLEARKLVSQNAIPDIDASGFNFEKGNAEHKSKAMLEVCQIYIYIY